MMWYLYLILLLKNLYVNVHVVCLGRHRDVVVFLLQLCVPHHGPAGGDVAACHELLRVSAARDGCQQTASAGQQLLHY